MTYDYPEGYDGLVNTWEWELTPVDRPIVCSILRIKAGHLCGYARFPERPVREQGYDGILRYVPVHGGITYAHEGEDGSMVYGFDCAHSGDVVPIEFERHPEFRERDGRVWLPDEVEVETNRMVVGIKAAAPFEERFLLASTGEERAVVLDEYHEELGRKGIAFDLSDNFGAMIGVLGGLTG